MGSPVKANPPAADMPEAVVRRGISPAQWNTLCRSLYPGANPASVVLVWDYCIARQLDPLKKPCHIVPMQVKDAKSGQYEWRDVVMPGVYELRTTAQRTGEYMGHSRPEFGPVAQFNGVSAPEWCSITTYRWNAKSNQRVEFPVTVFFIEAVATTKDGRPNQRWSKAPVQMLTKCTEAAGLREAFPDETGGAATAEEMEGQRAIDAPAPAPTRALPPKAEGFDDWLSDLRSAADNGDVVLQEAWTKSKREHRDYLTATDPDVWEQLKSRAAQAVTE